MESQKAGLSSWAGRFSCFDGVLLRRGQVGIRDDIWKNRPCPPVSVGRSRWKANLNASLTARLLMSASPASNPVSRGLFAPCRLPHRYIAVGHPAKAARPPSAIALLRLMTMAFDRSRALLCWSLPTSTPDAAAKGKSHAVSVARM
jgi:hypothetical protein